MTEIKDTKEIREFMLVPDGTSNDVSRELYIQVQMKGRLPLISMSQSEGVGATSASADGPGVDYNNAFSSLDLPAPAAADVKNYPFDPTPGQEQRFKLVTYVADTTKHNDGHIFYDAKYNDMFLLATLNSFGEGSEIDTFKGIRTVLDGYIIGAEGGNIISTPLCSISDNDITIVAPAVEVPSKTHILQLSTNDYGVFDKLVRHFGDTTIESSSCNIQNFLGMGPSTALFGGPITAYRLVRSSFNSSHYVRCSGVDISDCMIAIP